MQIDNIVRPDLILHRARRSSSLAIIMVHIINQFIVSQHLYLCIDCGIDSTTNTQLSARRTGKSVKKADSSNWVALGNEALVLITA